MKAARNNGLYYDTGTLHLRAGELARYFVLVALAGGQGGSILLRAKEILIEGCIHPGNGGNALNGGRSGTGGSITLLSGNTYYEHDLKAGKGGSGGHGGRGGDAHSLWTPGANGASNSGSGAIVGGNGGNGTDSDPGGDGGDATSTDGNATGGNGGNGGNGMDAPFPGFFGFFGGNGGRGGNGIGGNSTGSLGGSGIGGSGGNGGNGGSSIDLSGGGGGAGGDGGNGCGGSGVPGGTGSGGLGGAGGTGGAPDGMNGSPGTNGISKNGHTVLPVNLVFFRAAEQEGLVALHWNTATEINNSGFRVEHSATGKLWESIGFIKGTGTTQEQQSYSFTHSGFSDGMNYYRLRQIDFDGGFEYSGIVSIKMTVKGRGFSVYPNPSSGSGLLLLEIHTAGQGALTIFNQLGEKIYQAFVREEQKGLEITLPGLPSGIYTVELNTRHDRFVEQLVVE